MILFLLLLFVENVIFSTSIIDTLCVCAQFYVFVRLFCIVLILQVRGYKNRSD